MMKYFVFALLVAAAVAAPTPQDENDIVELVVNGVPEGQPLEIGEVVDIKLQEHINGELASSSDLLRPLTAAGLAEAAAAAEAAVAAENEVVVAPIQIVDESVHELVPVFLPAPVISEVAPVVLPEPTIPEVAPVVLPEPAVPEVVPVVLPEPAVPEVAPVVLPEPIVPGLGNKPDVVIPEPSPIDMPAAALPEVVPEVEVAPVPLPQPEPLPQPAPQIPTGEVYNDGLVQVQVNAPQEESMLTTLQSWFNLVMNYFNNGVQTTQQII